jgi:hypothetical protein
MTDDRPEPVEEGGDPACWLDRVCEECGAFLEGDAADHRCGGSTAST